MPNGKADSQLLESLQIQERKGPDLKEKVGEKGTGRVPSLASVKCEYRCRHRKCLLMTEGSEGVFQSSPA